MNHNEKYNKEEYDDKAENYILELLFENEDIVNCIYNIYETLWDQKVLETLDKKWFFSKMRQAFFSEQDTKIWDDKKLEITMLFYGRFIRSKEDLLEIINDYKTDIQFFRKMNVNAKWIIFYFIEIIIEKMVDIDDSNFEFFKYTNSAKDEMYDLMEKAVTEWLNLLVKDTSNVLSQFNTFYDKYISWDNEYLDDIELELFKSKYIELIKYIILHISSDIHLQNKVKNIEDRINNFVKFD